MKQNFTFFFFLLCSIAANAQFKNNGFELVGTDAKPNFWNGVIYPINVYMDTNGVAKSDSILSDGPLYAVTSQKFYAGQNALRLSNAFNVTTNVKQAGVVFASPDSLAYGGFSGQSILVKGRPESLGFMGLFESVKNDVAYASVVLFDANLNEIGSGELRISQQQTAFTRMDVPLTYTSSDDAAFAQITFSTAAPGTEANLGTFFYVDEVAFSYNTSLVSEDFKSPISIYPNPTTNEFQLQIEKDRNVRDFILVDLYGRRVPVIKGVGNVYHLDHVTEGIYMVIVTTYVGADPNKVDKTVKLKLVVKRQL